MALVAVLYMRTRTRGTIELTPIKVYAKTGNARIAFTEFGTSFPYGSPVYDPPYLAGTFNYNTGLIELFVDELKYRTGTGLCYQTVRGTAYRPRSNQVAAISRWRVLPILSSPFQNYATNLELDTDLAGHRAMGLVRAQGAIWDATSSYYSGLSVTGGTPLLTVPTELDRKLVARVMSHISTLNLSVTIGEAREFPTLWRMFTARGALWRFVSQSKEHANVAYVFITSFRRDLTYKQFIKLLTYGQGLLNSRLNSAAKQLFALNRDITLGWCFGLAPTVRDAKAIYGELSKASKDRLFRGTTLGVRNDAVSVAETGALGGGMWAYNVRGFKMESLTQIRSCHIRFKRNAIVSDAANYVQRWVDRYVGTSAYQTLWALFPISFGIDWVLSVDDVLDALFLSEQKRYEIYWRYSEKLETTISANYQVISDVHPETSLSPHGANPQKWGYYTAVDTIKKFHRTPTSAPIALNLLGASKPSAKKLYLAALIACGLRRK